MTAQSRRLALVIGNSSYMAAPRLHNARNDANAFAAALKKLDFRVIEGFDLGRDDTEDLREKFETGLEQAEVALFYFAGHGLQLNGENFLLPIDADIKREAHLFSRTLNLSHQLNAMAQRATSSLLFIDACRENPFPAMARSTPGAARGFVQRTGLAAVTANGSLIAFATSPNDVAADDIEGGDDGHSPFTQALLRHIEEPGLSIGGMMLKVRQDVHKSTNGRQIPWDHNSLLAEFYFNPPSNQPAVVTPADVIQPTKPPTSDPLTSGTRGKEPGPTISTGSDRPIRPSIAFATIAVVVICAVVLAVDWYKPNWTCQIADREACHADPRAVEEIIGTEVEQSTNRSRLSAIANQYPRLADEVKLRIDVLDAQEIERVRSSLGSLEDRPQLAAIRDKYPQLAGDVARRIAALDTKTAEIDALRRSIPSLEDRGRLAAIRGQYPQLADEVARRVAVLDARDAGIDETRKAIPYFEDRNELAALRERYPQLAVDIDRRLEELRAKDAEIDRVRQSLASMEDVGKLAAIREQYPQLADPVDRRIAALDAQKRDQARRSIASLDDRAELDKIRQLYPQLASEVDRRINALDARLISPVGYVIYGAIDSHINMRRPFFSLPGISEPNVLPQPDALVECVCKTGDFNLRPIPIHYDLSAKEMRPIREDLQTVARILMGGKVRLNGDMYLTHDVGNSQWYLVAPVGSVDGQDLKPLSAPFNPVLGSAEVLGYVYLGKIDGAALSDQRFSNETRGDAVFPEPGDRIKALKETGLYREPSRWDPARKTYVSEGPLRRLAVDEVFTVAGDLILSRKNTTVWAPLRKR